MRILLVSNGFPPFSTHGTEMYTYNLARALKEAGETVHVFFPLDRELAAYETMTGSYDGIPYTAMQRQTVPPSDLRYYYNNPAVNPVFILTLNRFKPDIVHFTYVLMGLSASLITWTKKMGIPAVVTLTDVHFPCMRGQMLDTDNALCTGPEGGTRCSRVCFASSGFALDDASVLPEETVVTDVWSPRYEGINPLVLRDRYLRTVLRGADRVIAPTAWVRAVLLRWGIPPDLILQAEYGIDDRVLLRHEHRPADHVRIGYIGQLLPHKGPQTLFEAFSYCEDPTAELKVYGDYEYGPARSFLRGMVRYTTDPRMRFLGTFPHDQIGVVLSQIDVLVIPSIWHENSPLVLRNAVATRTPVIVSDTEGMRPYVHHMGNGLLYEVGSVDDLYLKLQLVLDNPELLDDFRRYDVTTTKIAEDAALLVQLYTALLRDAGAGERGGELPTPAIARD